jgi:hypothetical protein
MERVERIKHLNVRGFWAQGIVSADASTPISIASFRAADFPQTMTAGSPPTLSSSYPSRSSALGFANSSWRLLPEFIPPVNSSSSVIWLRWPNPPHFSATWHHSNTRNGWFTPNRPLAAPYMSWSISAATRIAWPFPTAACCLSKTASFLSNGKISRRQPSQGDDSFGR